MSTDLAIVMTSEFDGGAEGYVRRLAATLSRIGLSLELWGTLPVWPEDLPQRLIGAGPKWRLRTLPLGLARLPREQRRLRRTLSEANAAVYNLHFKREQIGFTTLLARRGKVVWTEHGRFPRGVFGVLLSLPYRLASRRVSAIICVSDAVQTDIGQKVSRRSRSKMITVDSAVDVDVFRPASLDERLRSREELGIAHDEFVAAFVSRLEPSKRPLLAITASELAGSGLIIAGAGSEERSVARAASGSIRFVGLLSDPRVVYRAADVALFLSTGQGEGFPTVLLEAAAQGLPIISVDGHGFESDIRAAGGIVTDPNADAIAAVIESFKRDKTARSDAAARAREWALRRDLVAWAVKYRAALGLCRQESSV